MEGSIDFNGPNVTGCAFEALNGTVKLSGGTLTISEHCTAEIANFVMVSSTLTGAGTLEITSSLSWPRGTMSGSGKTILLPAASYSKTEPNELLLKQRTLINEGSFTISKGLISLEENAVIENTGTFTVNAEGVVLGPLEAKHGSFVNEGTFQKTSGIETYVDVRFENYGVIKEASGSKILFKNGFRSEPSTAWGGEANPQEPALCGGDESVGCQTGNYSQTQTDFSVGGRGVGLVLSRTYNSQAAVESVKGPFGYGWSSSFSDHLVGEPANQSVKLVQAEGSTITFSEGSGETFTAPVWTQDVLTGSSSSGYTLTLENQSVYKFNGSTGRLESVTDRNGNATTLSYSGSGSLETITDPAGRKVKLAYNAEGLVESSEDPMKHVVKYTYEKGNLTSVTQPGEAALRWQFKYDSSHRMTELTDGRGGKTTIEYNGSNQVVSETDPMKRTTSFEYTAFHTKTTNHATGDVTVQYFTSNGMGTSVTNGYGTASATTETRIYNSANEMLTDTDGNGHTTKYRYDMHGNRTSMVNPDGDETKWEYDSAHDVISETTPSGETTTIKRDSHGNPEVIERPAPGGKTQITKYKYGFYGKVKSMTNPLEDTWEYEYDSYGDRVAEINPDGDKHTWEYNEDSQEIGMVSPRGHVKSGEEEKYRTKTERDAQGRPIKVTDPLGHETKYTYDGDGNVETKTDPEGKVTAYTYNADNELTLTKEPDGAVTESEYDGAGQMASQTNGDKHITKYVRNVLEQVVEIIDPLGRKMLKEYDAAGNLTKTTNALKQTTTYNYDNDNRLAEVSYSDGKTPTVKYEYNANGDRTKMEDGSGATSYEYDQLGRLTHTKDGHGDTVSYEYNLANQPTTIMYPNGKALSREYDEAGRLKAVTDWLEHTTKFSYDADGNLTATTFPSESSDEDTYAYEADDAMSEIKMTKGAEALASLAYTHDKDGDVTKVTSTGLPGEEETTLSYDASRRLTKGAGASYEYDEANNPTTIGATTYKYDAANELEKAEVAKATTATYAYNELGERAETTPTTGPATAYNYDQAGNLTGVSRVKEGETPAIEDSYGYNGDGLRVSETIKGSTSYLAWDNAEQLPLLLTNGAYSFIYGPGGLPIEQIANSGETVQYLHHDQQGSTRLITSSVGSVAGAVTYDPYGSAIGRTGTATSPLGYGGQYTNSDTGLIYLRAREYDPATGQFLSVDPEVELTREVYGYAKDNPVSYDDPTGKETPTSEEIEFSDNYMRIQSETTAALKRKHESSEVIDEYREVCAYYYFAIKAEIADNDGNPENFRNDQEAYQKLYASLADHIAGDFAPLVKAETTTGWAGVIRDLARLIKKLYRIRIVLHHVP